MLSTCIKTLLAICPNFVYFSAISALEATIIDETDTYIEDDTSHSIRFNLAITIPSGGVGANDAIINRWKLVVSIVGSDTNALASGGGPWDLVRSTGGAAPAQGELTNAQADLIINPGETKTMENVVFNFNPSLLPNDGLCPDITPGDPDTRYIFKVELQASTASGHTVVGTNSLPPVVDQDGRLTCRGKGCKHNSH